MTWHYPSYPGVGGGVLGLPTVSRVIIRGKPLWDGHGAEVVLEFDRAMPANCHVQLFRFNPKAYTGSRGERRSGFRRVYLTADGSRADLPLVPITEGSTSVTVGTILRLFRPPKVTRIPKTGIWRKGKGRYYNTIPEPQQNLEMPVWMRQPNYGRRDTKVYFKFGVTQGHNTGYMSAETVKIERWIYSLPPLPLQQVGIRWGLKVTVR